MFHYESLKASNREIRLVRFVAGTNESQHSHSLQLATVSLNKNPSYSALSYVWGKPLPTVPITVDGERFDVSENLHYALGQLSRNLRAEMFIWIDAVCIDQSDAEERSWQVAQMRDIFRWAESVYVCLGDSVNNSDLVMNLAQDFGQEAVEAGVLELWSNFPSKGHRADIIPKTITDDAALIYISKLLECESFRDHRLPNAIMALLERPYWFRCWIVQEIALAGRGYVLCGNQIICLDAFHATLTAIYFAKIGKFARHQPQWNAFGDDFNSNNSFHIRGLLVRLQNLRGQAPTLLGLLSSEMRQSRGKRPFYIASDGRDIIFGLLGIAIDTELLGLRPDYLKTVEEVYTTVTKEMILYCRDYSLDYCTFPKDTPRLPSWVPDWRRIGRYGLEGRPFNYPDSFNASRGRMHLAEAETSDFTLRQLGCVVDSVVAVFAFEVGGAFEQHIRTYRLTLSTALASDTNRSRCLRSIYEFAKPYLSKGSSESSLWRTMLGGRIWNEKLTEQFDFLAYRAFHEEEVAADSIDESQLACILRNTYPFPLERKHVEDLQLLVNGFCHRIVNSASAMARGRTLFVTTEGRFGLGPQNLCAGDVVTILIGTNVPIVLRHAGDRYTYLGGAYLEGIMEGEYMETEKEEVEFHII